MARSRNNRKSQRNNRRSRNNKKSQRNGKQKGGRVVMPIQYFNPDAQTPAYYPRGSEILNQQYQSAYGPIDAVNTTHPNSCMTQMGPNLAPFSPYNEVTGTQTGGNGVYDMITNPLTGRKVSIRSKLGQQVLNNYIKKLSH